MVGVNFEAIYPTNTNPADFIRQNLMMLTNVIHAAHNHPVQKLLFMVSMRYLEIVTKVELTHTTPQIVGYQGRLAFDSTWPSGAYRKLIDSSRFFKLGWHPKVAVNDGLSSADQIMTASATFRLKPSNHYEDKRVLCAL